MLVRMIDSFKDVTRQNVEYNIFERYVSLCLQEFILLMTPSDWLHASIIAQCVPIVLKRLLVVTSASSLLNPHAKKYDCTAQHQAERNGFTINQYREQTGK